MIAIYANKFSPPSRRSLISTVRSIEKESNESISYDHFGSRFEQSNGFCMLAITIEVPIFTCLNQLTALSPRARRTLATVLNQPECGCNDFLILRIRALGPAQSPTPSQACMRSCGQAVR